MERAQLEQNITSVNLQDMAAILNNTALQVQPFEPNVSRDRGEKTVADCVVACSVDARGT